MAGRTARCARAAWITAVALAGAACSSPPRGDRAGAATEPARAPEPESGRARAPQTARSGFRPPALQARIDAIGGTAMGSDKLMRAFTPSDAFEPIPPVEPGDWLDVHRERGQTFEQFVLFRFNRPEGARDTIYLLPAGDLREGHAVPIERLAEFLHLYFSMPVEVLPRIAISELGARSRVHAGITQLRTRGVLHYLKRHLPRDAFALIAITGVDLYPNASWNFVFGEASLRDRVAVQSLVRYDPSFAGVEVSDEVAGELALRRSLTVIAHEVGHMFGFEHCIYYRCAMNGSNGLRELDGQPLHLGPVCLRKLRQSVRFDPELRYRRLSALYSRLGLGDEAAWTSARAEEIAGE